MAKRSPSRGALVALGALTMWGAACPADETDRDDVQAWTEAERAWRQGDLNAYRLWTELRDSSATGREARSRIREADSHYKRGIRMLEAGDAGAKDELAKGVALAPMNPDLYLRLARACRDRDIALRAAEYYSKYLALFPNGAESDAARSELRQLDPELAGILGPASAAVVQPTEPQRVWLPFLIGLLAGAAVALGTQAGFRWFRGRGISLQRLVRESPEFHPAVAYLVGSLRHELLKHRIGAAADALATSTNPTASEDRLSFLHERLFGGQPLEQAWEGHVVAFEQALGHRVDIRRDRWFRSGGRAVRQISALSETLRSGDAAALATLRKAHSQLMNLDRALANLVGDLVRTPLDRNLLEEVVDEVRAEHSAGRVEVDGIDIEPPSQEIVLEVFRVDLVLILKNILRNALLAVNRSAPPRRVGIRVQVELEPTGEEIVTIQIQDSSDEPLDSAILFDRRVDRGLGLVAAAVHRYGGSIDVVETSAPFRKAVVVSFFRVMAAIDQSA